MGISARNICKSFETGPALKDVSLDIEDGAFVTLLGATGAGKTTLLRILCGIERPDCGQVFYDDKDVTGIPVQKRNVAMVYQEFINYPSLTIYDNIASPLRISRTKYAKSEIDGRVRQTAEMLGLSAVLNHYPEEVSGGQKQRTAIARALAKDTKFIFLDEPLANLDYKLREELRGELKTILGQKGGVVVYATPEPVDALSMSTHVGYFESGELLQYGDLEEVYRKPAQVEVGAYFSYPTMNIMPARKIQEQAGTYLRISDEISIELTPFADRLQEQEYLVGIRAYNLHTHTSREGMISFQATLELSEELGSDTELHLSHGSMRFVMLMQEVVRYPVGTNITVYMDPCRLFIYSKKNRKLVLKTFLEE
ncbi:MAG: ABC transporter ATP-binding protein [Desulfohalobiaceae bacterium]|nr:ABC transporter ATP-binding protein [Desulfohalobiaceae bacterium]